MQKIVLFILGGVLFSGCAKDIAESLLIKGIEESQKEYQKERDQFQKKIAERLSDLEETTIYSIRNYFSDEATVIKLVTEKGDQSFSAHIINLTKSSSQHNSTEVFEQEKSDFVSGTYSLSESEISFPGLGSIDVRGVKVQDSEITYFLLFSKRFFNFSKNSLGHFKTKDNYSTEEQNHFSQFPQ